MISVKSGAPANLLAEAGRSFSRGIRKILPGTVKHLLRQVLRVTSNSRQVVFGARSPNSPTKLTARGVSEKAWRRSQTELELNYWVHQYPKEVPQGKGLKEHYQECYWSLNRSMFKTIPVDYTGKTVVDIGCGPFGSLDFRSARVLIGVESLARDYQNHYGFDENFVVIDAPAEQIPLLDGVADVVVCINALDHFHKPYSALEEMVRLCKAGGHFLLATDVGGTPDHPCNINRRHLDEFIKTSGFDVVEKDCGTHIPSSWEAEAQIPLYVFHGVKR